MYSELSPGERLLDRLMMGYTDPDQELLDRAYNFRAWADKHPVQAMCWIPKLRRTNYCTARLWKAIEHIVDPRTRGVPPAPPPAPQKAHAVQIEYQRTASTAAGLVASFESGLPREYTEWKRSIPTALIAEAKTFAPAKTREAVELEIRAASPIAEESKRAILKRAASVWAALLNIKEPSLW